MIITADERAHLAIEEDRTIRRAHTMWATHGPACIATFLASAVAAYDLRAWVECDQCGRYTDAPLRDETHTFCGADCRDVAAEQYWTWRWTA